MKNLKVKKAKVAPNRNLIEGRYMKLYIMVTLRSRTNEHK